MMGMNCSLMIPIPDAKVSYDNDIYLHNYAYCTSIRFLIQNRIYQTFNTHDIPSENNPDSIISRNNY